MIYKLRHIFIFLFVFSVFSLTLQASIINACKDSKVFKNQSQNNPVTEEEEESHDADEDADEEYYLGHDNYTGKSTIVKKLFWLNSEYGYPSYTRSIPIPPPKF
ncbi:MAG: hypothetical protein IPL10_19205 [Bacteroidetes bacterium]|jgi:hypothetical protein|nr:hypothetical protein [Bacteroidota bacterium]